MGVDVITARQLVVVTRKQLLSAGMTANQIDHALRRGRFRPLHHGVFLTVAGDPSFEQRAIAAAFACGEGAAVSHRSAAAIWSLLPSHDGPVTVTVPGGRQPTHRDIDIRRSRSLMHGDRTYRGPIPVTTPERTLLDLVGVDPTHIDDVVDDALRRALVTSRRLERMLRRPELANARGIATLRVAVADRARNGIPESVLETRALRLLRDFGLPDPVHQHVTTIRGRSVRFDLAYPDDHVAIELDGRPPDWGKARWQSDHERHNATELGGWVVLRFTWHDVTEDPTYVAITIAAALGLRPRAWKRNNAAVR